MLKRPWQTLFILTLAAYSLFAVMQPAKVAAYGAGIYGTCSYNCPAKTGVALPSGFLVVVNLTDGQVIPYTGYTVVVQPASGQIGTIKKVDFYLDDVLQTSNTPNELGAARWLWEPAKPSETHKVKLNITANDGSFITKEYAVTVSNDASPHPIIQNVQQASSPDNIFGAIFQSAANIVGSWPLPVIYLFPYVLLALLLVVIIFLLLQTQRELREITTRQRIISIERRTGLEKSAFISLTSHYLRTPLSVIEGGFDLLTQSPSFSKATASMLRATIDALRLKVDALLARTDAASQISGAPEDPQKLRGAWRNPGLYVPLLLIGLLVFSFDYLATHAGTLSVNQINFGVQALLYVLLGVVLYQMFRRRQLNKRDVQSLERALAHEQAINQTRDELISTSVNLLVADIQKIKDTVSALPPNDAVQYMQDGIIRFKNVLSKFAIAGQLKGGHDNSAFVPTSLGAIMATLPQNLTNSATNKGVRIVAMHAEETFTAQNPSLLGYVMATIITNAITYSPDHGIIEVATHIEPDRTHITITDHGVGIAPQKIAMLFQPFSQINENEQYTHEGMGFSLYLDKLILAYLGGEISITSKPQVATVVSLSLPAN